MEKEKEKKWYYIVGVFPDGELSYDVLYLQRKEALQKECLSLTELNPNGTVEVLRDYED